MNISKERALDYHSQGRPGKIEVVPTKPTSSQIDLALAYTPGVAIPVLEIAENPELAYAYTAKGNLVAVISNGTAILGLGDRGPLAAKPVMEGKGVLFKRFADIDVFDIELDARDPDEIIRVVKALAPTFGGINLEDIKAPECFYIEEKLKSMLDIPVFHDDQHGTAIISTAGLINAMALQNKHLNDVEIVVNGAGAAAIACAELFVVAGARRDKITLVDTRGVVYLGRSDGMNEYKSRFARETANRSLADAMRGADVFVGLSVAGVVTPEMVLSMNENPVIFAMANPDPEIPYELAKATRADLIMATGRSDFPNQVNNVLGFPFIFRGALDVHARQINDDMKMAAVNALVKLAREDVPDSVLKAYNLKSLQFGPEYIIPKPFDPRALTSLAPAVAEAAMKSGVARRQIDLQKYKEELEARLGKAWELMRTIVNKARSNPKRIVFAEGDHAKIIRAAYLIKEQEIAIPVLLGNAVEIRKKITELGMQNFNPEIIFPEESDKLALYAKNIFDQRQRKGLTHAAAIELMKHRRYFGPMMVKMGDASAYLAGITTDIREILRPALQVVGVANGVHGVASMYIMIVRNKVYFFADATVNIEPDAERLAEIAIMTADGARRFNIEPRVAMLSFSNFGSNSHPSALKMKQATELVKARRPDIAVDGEMMADTAVTPGIIDEFYFFSSVKDANVLIFPSLEAANVAYKLLHRLGGAEAIGPVLLGMGKAVHVLAHEDEVRNIVNMAALAVVDAQNENREF